MNWIEMPQWGKAVTLFIHPHQSNREFWEPLVQDCGFLGLEPVYPQNPRRFRGHFRTSVGVVRNEKLVASETVLHLPHESLVVIPPGHVQGSPDMRLLVVLLGEDIQDHHNLLFYFLARFLLIQRHFASPQTFPCLV